MQRLYRSGIGTVLVLGLLWGCGSTNDETGSSGSRSGPQPGLVMRFIGFDSSNIIQQDLVTPNSAQVDVFPSICTEDFLFTEVTFEVFTQTIINAIFVNEQRLDILLNGYRVHFDDPQLGLGDLDFNVSAILRGRRCSNVPLRACAVDSDCIIPGQMSDDATCEATPTNVDGILLFDFRAKELMRGNTRRLGEATTVTITFYGEDAANRSFNAQAAYVVTFDDFCNCPDGSFCVDPSQFPVG